MKKIVLFDIDGTLINAGGCGIKALNKAIVKMGGKENICSYFQLQGSTDRDNFERAYKTAFSKKLSKKEFEKLKAIYLEILPQEVNLALNKGLYKKIKGVEKFLDFLSKRSDVLVGLATGNLEEGSFIKLAPSGLSKYFGFGGFGENFTDRQDMLKEAVKEAQKITGGEISSNKVYIIGDTEKDVQAAKACFFHSGIVIDGFGDPKKLRSNAPELIEKNFSNIKPWLIWLGLKKDPKGIKRGSYICPDTPIEHAYYGMTGSGSFLSKKDFKKMDKMIKKARITQ